jgi:hypothetical protein
MEIGNCTMKLGEIWVSWSGKSEIYRTSLI